MEHLNALFGRRLRTLRKGRDLTLEALGKASGIGFKHIAEIERGEKVPSFEAIGRLAEALKVEAYELFLPERVAGDQPDQAFKVVARDIEKHGSAALKSFAAQVLAAAKQFEAAG